MRRSFEIATLVAASWIFAYLTSLLTLGLVRLKTQCEFCGSEIALTNIWSHMRWHQRRGEWP